MFKKILLTLTVLLLVVGCGSTNNNNNNTGNNNNANNNNATGNEPSIINVYTRDSTSGTREAFEDGIALEDAGELTANAVETSGNGDMAAKVGADAEAIGYVSLTTDFAANNIKPLNFNGVEPTLDTVLSGDYTLSRPFMMTTRATGDFTSDKHEQVVAAFIDFIMNSSEGLLAVDAEGGIVDVDAGTAWADLATEHPVLEEDLSDVTLRTVGSTSVVNTLTAALEAFEAETGVGFVMNHSGSGDAYHRVLGEEKDGANAGDLGFASRPFKDEELDDNSLIAEAYALDAVVVVVNADNADISDITAEQVASIFVGETTDWSALK